MNTLNFTKQAKHTLKAIIRFRVSLFVLVVAILYGIVIWRVIVLTTQAPDQSTLASQAGPTQPNVDPAIVNKITQLQDNSVSVQTLFNEARQNPFHE